MIAYLHRERKSNVKGNQSIINTKLHEGVVVEN